MLQTLDLCIATSLMEVVAGTSVTLGASGLGDSGDALPEASFPPRQRLSLLSGLTREPASSGFHQPLAILFFTSLWRLSSASGDSLLPAVASKFHRVADLLFLQQWEK